MIDWLVVCICCTAYCTWTQTGMFKSTASSNALAIFSPSAHPSDPPRNPKLWVTHMMSWVTTAPAPAPAPAASCPDKSWERVNISTYSNDDKHHHSENSVIAARSICTYASWSHLNSRQYLCLHYTVIELILITTPTESKLQEVLAAYLLELLGTTIHYYTHDDIDLIQLTFN